MIVKYMGHEELILMVSDFGNYVNLKQTSTNMAWVEIWTEADRELWNR